MKKSLTLALTSAVILFSTFSHAAKTEKAVLAGGCFWCMESDFEKLEGVTDVISGFTGGKLKNPTYNGNHKGHYEAVEITYDPAIVSYQGILDHYWVNIDPFDAKGQFCDKGYSYRSVAFYKFEFEKDLINKSVLNIEKKFDKKIVTYIRKFDKFYEAERHHQNYYKENFINYLMYKNGCGRVKILEKIWN